MLICANTSEWLPQLQQTPVICIRCRSAFSSVVITASVIPFLSTKIFPLDGRHKEKRTEHGGFCFGTSVSSPNLSLPLPLWCSGVIITLSVEDLTTGQLGHRLGEAPISMRVCYFFPQFIALPFILPDSPTDIRGLLE